MEASVRNLDRWMDLLPSQIQSRVPIIYLAIPGSHNSMSYAIGPTSTASSDGNVVVQVCNIIRSDYTYRWFKDQEDDVLGQLKGGARYFDLRICRVKIPQNLCAFYFCHGFVSVAIQDPLLTIARYLQHHTRELVILDFQHFYDFVSDDHLILQQYLDRIFGDLIIGPKDSKLSDLTLQRAYSLQKQVIVIYRHKCCCEHFWDGKFWPNPWANTTDVNKLQNFLDQSTRDRPANCGYITQCILTPSFEFVGENLDKSMVEIAEYVYKSMKRWISHQSPGVARRTSASPKINIVIADFINLNKFKFCRHIIKLNERLIKSK